METLYFGITLGRWTVIGTIVGIIGLIQVLLKGKSHIKQITRIGELKSGIAQVNTGNNNSIINKSSQYTDEQLYKIKLENSFKKTTEDLLLYKPLTIEHSMVADKQKQIREKFINT